jgi:nuclear cap-binding protein subunit 1
MDVMTWLLMPGDQEDCGRQWQPYTDFLVSSVVMALPWGGNELAESAPAEMEKLFTTIEQYMAKRPRPSQPALRPFFEAKDEDDIPAQSDSGGASFLGQASH